MKKLSYILLLIVFKITAQTVTPTVINSAGGYGQIGSSGYEVYYNIGEPIITTANNGTNTITQGFLQPEFIGLSGLKLQPRKQDESCLNNNDGAIYLDSLHLPPNTHLTFLWINGNGDTLCKSMNCNYLDSLAPNTYSVLVNALDNTTNSKIDSLTISLIINSSSEVCYVKTYTAFSPNNDNLNDAWIIVNIDQFPNNVVTFYNRWGNELIRIPNYDNASKVWHGETTQGLAVPNGTYFYVIELNKAGAKPLKGWVEITGK